MMEAALASVVIDAVQRGAARPGAVATSTGIGATVTYQLIDRLIAEGRICMARDGTLKATQRPASRR